MIDAPTTIATLARYVARKAIRELMQADGYKPRDVTLAMIDAAARAWLQANPWAFEYAAKRIEKSPRLRAMAECKLGCGNGNASEQMSQHLHSKSSLVLTSKSPCRYQVRNDNHRIRPRLDRWADVGCTACTAGGGWG